MTRAELSRWIDAYERAWRTPGTAALAELFTQDAIYLPAPFDPPLKGLPAIARFWEAERDSPQEQFTLTEELLVVEGDMGVARVEVYYRGPPQRTYRDLWVVTLDALGRCSAFEEWPFFPQQQRSARQPA